MVRDEQIPVVGDCQLAVRTAWNVAPLMEQQEQAYNPEKEESRLERDITREAGVPVSVEFAPGHTWILLGRRTVDGGELQELLDAIRRIDETGARELRSMEVVVAPSRF